MKYILPLLVILFVAFLVVNQRGKPQPDNPSVTIRGHTFAVELAKTDEQKQKGLGDRATLEKDTGMLFFFDTAKVETFWMYGMEFPIDIIFINDDKIVTIYKNVPIPQKDILPDQYERYSSKQPVNRVLEVNAGLALQYGFEEGDRVYYENISY